MLYKEMNMPDLKRIRLIAESDLDKAKKELNNINAEIESRIKPFINSYGTHHKEIDGVKIKCVNQKKVEWDEKLLAQKYSDMVANNVDPSPYIKHENVYKLLETSYKNWSEEWQEAFADARTEKSSGLKIEFEEE